MGRKKDKNRRSNSPNASGSSREDGSSTSREIQAHLRPSASSFRRSTRLAKTPTEETPTTSNMKNSSQNKKHEKDMGRSEKDISIRAIVGTFRKISPELREAFVHLEVVMDVSPALSGSINEKMIQLTTGITDTPSRGNPERPSPRIDLAAIGARTADESVDAEMDVDDWRRKEPIPTAWIVAEESCAELAPPTPFV